MYPLLDVMAHSSVLGLYLFLQKMGPHDLGSCIERRGDLKGSIASELRDINECPLIIIHSIILRLEYSCCRKAFVMDRDRLRNRGGTQELRSRKFRVYLTVCDRDDVSFLFCSWTKVLNHKIVDLSDLTQSLLSSPPSSFPPSHLSSPPRCTSVLPRYLVCNPLQALVQELNFSAYLGLPAFMIPLKGPHSANLARQLLNHIQTGHHSCNVSISRTLR